MGKKPQRMTAEDLLEYTHAWTSMRLRSFPLWDFDDIRNEAYVTAVTLLHRYDPDKGTLHQFLSQRLYDYVSRSYQKQNGIVVTRKRLPNGRWGKRQYNKPLKYMPTNCLPAPHHYDLEPHDQPDLSAFPRSLRKTAQMLSMGVSKSDCAKKDGLTPQAITFRMRKMRDLLDDC